MISLDEFLAAYDSEPNEWWKLDDGDQLNLFDVLREDRDGWRDQVVAIRAQQRTALADAEKAERRARIAEAAVNEAHTYCSRPAGVCLPIEPLPRKD